jgi:hypothetical protein
MNLQAAGRKSIHLNARKSWLRFPFVNSCGLEQMIVELLCCAEELKKTTLSSQPERLCRRKRKLD